MNKLNKKFRNLVIFSFFIIFSFLFLNKLYFHFYDKTYEIAIILDTKKDNELIKNGINLSAYENKVSINYIDIKNIKSIKQIEKKIDGIIILEVFNEDIKILEDFKKSILILGEDIPEEVDLLISYINSDTFEMGKEIADEILRNGNTRENIIFLSNNILTRSEKNTYKGFSSFINLSKNRIKDTIFNEKTIYEIFENNENNIFVTFDPYILDRICKIKYKNKDFTKKQIYGISKGNKRINYLENNILNGVIVKNEFSLGYLGLDTIYKMVQKKPYKKSKINFSLINKRNMYIKENQYLLFPFT